jgi:DNA-binding MarR family transcriptional regulator
MSSSVPFETTLYVRDNCLCLHAQRAARALARYFDEVLRPVGLTNQQFSLLMALNRPERRGFVRVQPAPADRRTRLLVLTKVGEEVLASALPIWRETHAVIERRLDAVDPDALRGALGDISDMSA